MRQKEEKEGKEGKLEENKKVTMKDSRTQGKVGGNKEGQRERK